MSDEKQETRDDIIAEMRNLGKLDEKSIDKIPRSLMGLGLRTYADRLEAAAKRERNNAAAMRDALEAFVEYSELALRMGMFTHDRLVAITAKARDALSKPPRNCNVGTAQEQAIRFDEFCQECEKCPLNDKRLNIRLVQCEFLWGQMPYEEGGAK